jgi:hypothetical protein
MVPGPSGILPGGEETPGTDANGNKPGEPGYDPKTDPGTTDANGNHPGDPGFDPNGPLYDPTGIPIQTPDEPPDGGEEPPPDGVPDPPPYDDPGGGDGYDPGGGGGEDLKYNPLAALRRMMAM